VVVTVPFDLLLNFLIGASVALAARADLRERAVPVMKNRYIAGALVFELLIFWPIGIYLYALHRDWSWMYLLDGYKAPAVLGVAAMAGYLGMLIGGYAAVHVCLQRRRDRLAYAVTGVVALCLLALTIALGRRLIGYGTYAEFHAGKAMPLWHSKLGYVLAGAGPLFAAGWLFLLRHFEHEGQRLASQSDMLSR
jgi:hypothetical protein